MESSVALCIPIYEHTDMVEEFLTLWYPFYAEFGIDVYYYDSSKSDNVKNVIEQHPELEHVYYVRCPEGIDADKKVYYIFQKNGLRKEYDFVWLSGDSIRCVREGLAIITKWLRPEYDVVVIDYANVERIGIKTYDEPNRFLLDCAHATTLWGSTIVNVRTMLRDVDWDELKKLFWEPRPIAWTHVGFYFFQIAKLEEFCGVHLPSTVDGVYLSRRLDTRKSSAWTESNAFWVNCASWVDVFEALPDIYEAVRWTACRKLCDSDLLPNKYACFKKRRQGLFSLRIFLKYKKYWKKMSSIPPARLFAISIIPQWCLKAQRDAVLKNGLNVIRGFSLKYNALAVYGAGVNGSVYGQYFEENGIAFDFFCVSRRRTGKYEFYGHPVREFGELEDEGKNTGFVVALSKGNVVEVLPELEEKVGKEHVFYDPSFTSIIGEELGYNLVNNLF